jgi:hypothetical protein
VSFVDDLELVSRLPYDPKSPHGAQQVIFEVLDRLAAKIAGWCPPGYTVRVSKGVGGLPDGLWIAALNDEVTSSPTRGIYLVYLFDRDRETVSLSLNQGITAAGQRARDIPGVTVKGLLRAEAYSIRRLLPGASGPEFSEVIRLGPGTRTSGYEAGNIASHTWSLRALPSEVDLEEKFGRMLDLYEKVVELKETHLRLHPGTFELAARDVSGSTIRELVFAPKDSSDYLTRSREYLDPQVRKRTHESLVRHFGEFARDFGYTPATNQHPIDLTLTRGATELLVEAKILDASHPAGGIRESIGQLFEYRKFLRSDEPEVDLCAVYDLEPSGAHQILLGDLGISAAWRFRDAFDGPAAARLAHV